MSRFLSVNRLENAIFLDHRLQLDLTGFFVFPYGFRISWMFDSLSVEILDESLILLAFNLNDFL